MSVRRCVTFEDTELPLEATRIAAGPARPSRAVDTSDADSWDTPPPGRELAEELARGLEAGDLSLAFPVSEWESYGWEFTVRADGRDVWFMLQASDEWLVISDTPRGFLERLRGVTFEEEHRKALTVLATILAPPRFTNVQWFTKDEFEAHQRGKPPL
jgi:hypothetical protein